MVEFVLVSGLVLLLLFSMVEIGLLLNARLALAAAVREGARRAAVEGGRTQGAVDRITQLLALGGLDAAQAEIAITPREASYGTTVTVTVTCGYRWCLPFTRSLWGERVSIVEEVQIRSEKVR
jgi:Flp pilus assembly protein TadG